MRALAEFGPLNKLTKLSLPKLRKEGNIRPSFSGEKLSRLTVQKWQVAIDVVLLGDQHHKRWSREYYIAKGDEPARDNFSC